MPLCNWVNTRNFCPNASQHEQYRSEQLAIAVLWPLAKRVLAEVFVADARLSAQGYIPASIIQWNVDKLIERINCLRSSLR